MIRVTMSSIRSMLFFFEGFQLSAASVSMLDADVARHPAEHRVAGVGEPTAQEEFLQILGLSAHAGIALAEGHHGKSVSVQLRNQLCRVPAVPARFCGSGTAYPAR
jgi:hypothetical protein